MLVNLKIVDNIEALPGPFDTTYIRCDYSHFNKQQKNILLVRIAIGHTFSSMEVEMLYFINKLMQITRR